jgi:glycosyltransferase involved in cell wall biosynthesis
LIKPNFVEIASSEAAMPGDYAVFTGRLSPEKGLRTLLDAWRELAEVPLKILGDGPLMAELTERCRRESLNVQLLGMLPRDQVLAMVAGAQLQVVPSECFEGLPMAAVEAFGCGVPVIAARIGSLEEMIVPDENGLLFEAGNGRDLAKQVRRLRSDAPLRTRVGRGARDRYLEMYTPQRSLEALLGLYGRLAEESAGRSVNANGQHAGATWS